MSLSHDEIEAYNSKAEPVAQGSSAVATLNRTGWQLVHKYFPEIGKDSVQEKHVHPEDPLDTRFLARYISEDAMQSPIPLISVIASLPDSAVSGRLKSLHNQILQAIPTDDYSAWKLEELRRAVKDETTTTRTVAGVKYRTPKPKLKFKQAVRLYAMTIALLRKEDKWADKTDPLPPDIADFASRLSHQLPRHIPDGQSAVMFLYRPGSMNHPLSKEEFEERADVVRITRNGTTFTVEQFPVYLTADQKEWNPAWIRAKDEEHDSTLAARKFEHDWTRLDGPYLWYRSDLLDGIITYRATVRFVSNNMVIEAERQVQNRGAVKRVERPRDYDPTRITAFVPGSDAVAEAETELTVPAPSLDYQTRNLKRLGPYFSNGFRAWCAYGIRTSGLAPDGKTWIAVPSDEPRQAASTMH